MQKLLSNPIFKDLPAKPDQYRYGTAGFRMSSELLHAAACRLGPLFVERSRILSAKYEKSLKRLVFGVMVTASHNPAADNGLKIVEPPHAHMLVSEGEVRATQLARAHAEKEYSKIAEECLAGGAGSLPWAVVIGWDTRPSCQRIVDALTLTVEAAGGKVVKAGKMATPVLHWCVERANDAETNARDGPEVNVPPLEQYLGDLVKNFTDALKRDVKTTSSDSKILNRHIIVDCANGAGTMLMESLAKALDSVKDSPVKYTFQLLNTDINTPSKLNDQCGADYVQKQLVLPKGFTEEEFAQIAATKEAENKSVVFYSLDGDADRIVAGAVNSTSKKTTILEGDRFTALFGTVLAKKSDSTSSSSATPLTYGAVQTAYANGASTAYLKKAGGDIMKTEFALTGVKHVHHAAEKYDVGLYFESNGHGTVLASPAAADANSALTPQGRTVTSLCSQSCGDAVANLLAAEYALISLGWTTQQWLDLYHDLPCIQKKVKVAEPAMFKCAPGNEQQLVEPEGMQAEIDSLVQAANQKAGSTRAFIRPSGTEPVVRLYVESSEKSIAESLTASLEELVGKIVEAANVSAGL